MEPPTEAGILMSNLAATDDLFFNRAGLDRNRVERIVGDALFGADDGELFLEYCQSESVSYDDGRVRNASFDTMQRSEEHTSELQSLMRNTYAVFCLTNKRTNKQQP